MAYTQTPFGQSDLAVGIETDVTTTAVENVRSGATKLLSVYISSPSSVCNLKLYDDNGTGLSVGTTVPVGCLPCASGGIAIYSFDPPLEFEEGLSYAAATEDGTSASTSPTGTVPVYFTYKED